MRFKMRKSTVTCGCATLLVLGCWILLGISTEDNGARIKLPYLPHCYMDSTPSGKEWETFKSMVDALNSIDANYTVAAGTVLAWYRDCSLAGNDDLDFGIEFTWFMNNLETIDTALEAAGWIKYQTFGEPGIIGYEQSWKKGPGGIKADLFSIAEVNGKYVNGLAVDGQLYPCYSVQSTIALRTWNGLTFPVPAPTEAYLVGKYGTTWRQKHVKGYQWDVEPFKTENGRQHCFNASMPEFPEQSTNIG